VWHQRRSAESSHLRVPTESRHRFGAAVPRRHEKAKDRDQIGPSVAEGGGPQHPCKIGECRTHHPCRFNRDRPAFKVPIQIWLFCCVIMSLKFPLLAARTSNQIFPTKEAAARINFSVLACIFHMFRIMYDQSDALRSVLITNSKCDCCERCVSPVRKICFLQTAFTCRKHIAFASYKLCIEHGMWPFSFRNVRKTNFDHFIVSQQPRAASAKPTRIPSNGLLSTIRQRVTGFSLTLEGQSSFE
jgi:hypothetical protein